MAPIIATRRAASAPGADCFADLMAHWLDVEAETGMPIDARLWTQNPISSTYPACQAVKAAAEQGPEAAYSYLRRLREGLMIERKKLDHAEALVGEAGAAGLDVERFRIDLASNAITEAFAADLDEVRDPPAEARDAGEVRRTERHERLSFPSAVFAGDGALRPRRLGLAAIRGLPRGGPGRRRRGGRESPARAARGARALRPLRDPRARGAHRQAAPVLEAELWAPGPRLEAEARLAVLGGTIWERRLARDS